jgi:hypothetical protein
MSQHAIRESATHTGDNPLQPAENLRAYALQHARSVREVANQGAPLADLATTFPALLFALATGYADPETRAKVRAMVIAGAPLREAATAFGLPLWLRKLSPQAFLNPLPHLPCDGDFALQISNHVPFNTVLQPLWLHDVCLAHTAAGPEYALWAAAHPRALAGLTNDMKVLLGAFAWHSHRSQASLPAAAFLRRPWTTTLGMRRTHEECIAWLQRLALAEWLADGAVRPWIKDGVALGYTFRTLRTFEDFRAASDRLENCLDQYAHRLARNEVCVVAIERNRSIVGCLEIGRHDDDPAIPTIVQLRGVRNRRLAAKIWQAGYAWLAGSAFEPFTPGRLTPGRDVRRRTHDDLWRAYVARFDPADHGDHFARTILAVVARGRDRRRDKAVSILPFTILAPPQAARIADTERTRPIVE